MKAFSVAVSTNSPHGEHLTSILAVAQTRGEATAVAVHHAIDTVACGPHCNVTVRSTQATEISPDLLSAANEAIQRSNRGALMSPGGNA